MPLIPLKRPMIMMTYHPSRIFDQIKGPPAQHCSCCGIEEHTHGCGRGFTCDCTHNYGWFQDGRDHVCYRCHKCDKHCQCSEGVLTWEEMRLLRLREYKQAYNDLTLP